MIHNCSISGLYFNGFGDNFSIDSNPDLTEILPKNWSKENLRKYRQIGQKSNKFILKIDQDSKIVNLILLRISDEIAKNFSVDLNLEFQDLDLKNEQEFFKNAFQKLLQDFFPEPKSEKKSEQIHIGEFIVDYF